MGRRLFSLFLWVLVMGILTGCWDRREIEERVFVYAMAIDEHPEGVEVSIQIPIPMMIVGSSRGGEGEGGQGAVHNFTAVGKTLFEALENLQNQANRDLFLGHTRLLILSENVVRKKSMEILDTLRRQPEIRREIWPLIVDGRAKDALMINLRLAQIPTEYILDFLENGSNEGRMVSTRLGHCFINQSDPTWAAYVNYLHVEPGKAGGQANPGVQTHDVEGKVVWKGLAVMKGDRLTGTLTREESGPVLEIVEEKPGYRQRVECQGDKGTIVFKAKGVDPSVSVSQKGKKVNIRVKVKVWGEITESTCFKLDLSKKEVLDKAEQWIKRKYERQFRKTLNRVQKELRTDVFHFGPYIRAYHPQLWNRMDWEREFPKADIQVDYQVTIKNLGLESR